MASLFDQDSDKPDFTVKPKLNYLPIFVLILTIETEFKKYDAEYVFGIFVGKLTF